LRARLERARRDLDLVASLDAIRLKRATMVQGQFDFAGADQEYAQVFHAAGWPWWAVMLRRPRPG
jgi:hypothetical protein